MLKRIFYPFTFLGIFSILFLFLPLFTGQRIKAETEEKVRVNLRFKNFTPNIFRKKLLSNYQNFRELKLKNTFSIEVPKFEADKLIASLNKNIWVEFAEEDYVAYKVDIPNDLYFPDQWGLVKIQAKEGWDVTHGSKNINIAIVDTGINYKHPDLAGKISQSVDCISSSCPPYQTPDPDGHGTHVAGIAAAATDNSYGIAGVSWEGSLMSVKVLDDKGRGYYSWISNGIIWAVDNKADVINLSLGGSYPSAILRDSIKYAWDKGVVIVAASGNSGSSSPFYPAYYSWTIAVAATDSSDKKASFSNYGESWVDVAAPGTSILSTYQDGYAYLSGTSMAAPFVSGLAALVKSLHPDWGNQKIREKIEQTADIISGTGTLWRWGRINVCKALDCQGLEITPTSFFTSTPTVSLNTPTPTPTPTLSASPTPTPFVPTNSPSPTPISTLTPTPTLFPTPTPGNLPWWCKYIPWHYTCR